jgi:Tol biopolymer transport system component
MTSAAGLAAYADWSPDGAWLAYEVREGSVFGVHVARADGSGERRLLDAAAGLWGSGAPVWSGDGYRIAFDRHASPPSRNDRAVAVSWQSFELYVMNSDGSAVERLTHNEVSDVHPAR